MSEAKIVVPFVASSPDPEVSEKAQRRKFSAEDKKRILEEVDRAAGHGGIGAVLRREGIYSSTLHGWRKERDAAVRQAFSQKRGPQPRRNEHVGGAGVFRRHTPYFDSVSLAERRDDFGSDAFGLEGESDFVIEIVIPAHRLLFRPVGVHDGLVVDAVFPDRIFLRFFHSFASRIRRTEVRPIRNRRAISALLTPARYSFRTWLV